MWVTRLSALVVGLMLLGACRLPSSNNWPRETLFIPDVKPTPSIQERIAGIWGIRPLQGHAPDSPLTSDANGFRINPKWRVAQINYVYRWWGLGDPVYDSQNLALSAEGYVGVTRTVPSIAVDNLVASLSNLHPASELAGGRSHSDDYPSWYVRLLGTDGQEILLLSNSTVAPNGAPWNVYVDGRIYAQYDGALFKPLSDLFTHIPGRTAAAYIPAEKEPNTLPFSAEGLPPELYVGFSGLPELRDNFDYDIHPISRTIEGEIFGNQWIGDMKLNVTDIVTNVQHVRLEATPGNWIDCSTAIKQTRTQAATMWRFQCPVTGVAAGAPFRYPIRVDYQSKGNAATSAGVLIGVWQNKHVAFELQLSEEIQLAFAESPEWAELLRTHRLAAVDYVGSISPTRSLTTGTFVGNLTLLGAHTVSGKDVPYMVTVPFVLSTGRYRHFALTPMKLRQNLDALMTQLLVKRVLTEAPGSVLAIYYDEKSLENAPTISGLFNAGQRQFQVKLDACGSLPGTGDYPTATEPLLGFGFVSPSDWREAAPQFMLVNNHVAALSLWLKDVPHDRLSQALIPRTFDSAARNGIEHISIDRQIDGFSAGLRISLFETLDADSLQRIKAGLGPLPAPLDTDKDSTYWTSRDIVPAVDAEGHVTLATCAQ